MKKVFSVLLLTVLFIGATSATAFAYCGGRGMGYYGGNYGPSQAAPTYEVCQIEGCTIWGIHEHDGVYYHCQNYNSGYYGRGCGGGWNW